MLRRDFLNRTGYGMVAIAAGAIGSGDSYWWKEVTPSGQEVVTGTVFLYGRVGIAAKHLLVNNDSLDRWLDLELAGLKKDFRQNVMAQIEGRKAWGEFGPHERPELANWGPDKRFYGA